MQEKKALIKAYTFLTSPVSCVAEYQPRQRVVNLSITKNRVRKALLCQ